MEILRQPLVYTLRQCIKNLLLSPTGHKHIIHAGYTFADTGSWMLADGSLDISDFFAIFRETEVASHLKDTGDQWQLHVHATSHADWNDKTFSKLCTFSSDVKLNVSFNPNVSLSPAQKETRECTYLLKFLSDCLKCSIDPSDEMIESDVVGSIRFNKPTLYVFPSGQGDCSLFGITGFTMLIDGGFSPQPCFWSFVRHLERLDTVMITRLNEKNLGGFSSFFKKQLLTGGVYPHIGYVLCNNMLSNGNTSNNNNTDSNDSGNQVMANEDDLIISVMEASKCLLGNIKNVGLDARSCLRDSTIIPVTLYHKVGHGTLDLFILNPTNDSQLLHSFHMQCEKRKQEFVKVNSAVDNSIQVKLPLADLMSICCLLVWKPSAPTHNIIRILFPGSTPQFKIFEGLDKLKHLDILQDANCTRNSLRDKLNAKSKGESNVRLRSVSPLRKSRATSATAANKSSAATTTTGGGGGRSDFTRSTRSQQRVSPLPAAISSGSSPAAAASGRKISHTTKDEKIGGRKKSAPLSHAETEKGRKESDSSCKQAGNVDEINTTPVTDDNNINVTTDDASKETQNIKSLDVDKFDATLTTASLHSGDPQTDVIDDTCVENNVPSENQTDSATATAQDNNELMKSVDEDQVKEKLSEKQSETDATETDTATATASADSVHEINAQGEEEEVSQVTDDESANVTQQCAPVDKLDDKSSASRRHSSSEGKSSRMSSRKSSVACETDTVKETSESRRSSVASTRGFTGRKMSTGSTVSQFTNREASASRRASLVSESKSESRVPSIPTSRKGSIALSSKQSPMTSRKSSVTADTVGINLSRKNSLVQQPAQVKRESLSKEMDVKFTSDTSPAASVTMSPHTSRKASLTTDIKSSPVVSRRSSIDKTSSRRPSITSGMDNNKTYTEEKETVVETCQVKLEDASSESNITSEPVNEEETNEKEEENQFTEKNESSLQVESAIDVTSEAIETRQVQNDELFKNSEGVKSDSAKLSSQVNENIDGINVDAKEIPSEIHEKADATDESSPRHSDIKSTDDADADAGGSSTRDSQWLQGEEVKDTNDVPPLHEVQEQKHEEQEENEKLVSIDEERKQSITHTGEQIEGKETNVSLDSNILNETKDNIKSNDPSETKDEDKMYDKCIVSDIDAIRRVSVSDGKEKCSTVLSENVKAVDIPPTSDVQVTTSEKKNEPATWSEEKIDATHRASIDAAQEKEDEVKEERKENKKEEEEEVKEEAKEERGERKRDEEQEVKEERREKEEDEEEEEEKTTRTSPVTSRRESFALETDATRVVKSEAIVGQEKSDHEPSESAEDDKVARKASIISLSSTSSRRQSFAKDTIEAKNVGTLLESARVDEAREAIQETVSSITEASTSQDTINTSGSRRDSSASVKSQANENTRESSQQIDSPVISGRVKRSVECEDDVDADASDALPVTQAPCDEKEEEEENESRETSLYKEKEEIVEETKSTTTVAPSEEEKKIECEDANDQVNVENQVERAPSGGSVNTDAVETDAVDTHTDEIKETDKSSEGQTSQVNVIQVVNETESKEKEERTDEERCLREESEANTSDRIGEYTTDVHQVTTSPGEIEEKKVTEKADQSTDKEESSIDQVEHPVSEAVATTDASDSHTITSQCTREKVECSDESDTKIVPSDVSESPRKLSFQADTEETVKSLEEKVTKDEEAMLLPVKQLNESTSQLMETGRESPQITLTVDLEENDVTSRRQSVQETSVTVENDPLVTSSTDDTKSETNQEQVKCDIDDPSHNERERDTSVDEKVESKDEEKKSTSVEDEKVTSMEEEGKISLHTEIIEPVTGTSDSQSPDSVGERKVSIAANSSSQEEITSTRVEGDMDQGEEKETEAQDEEEKEKQSIDEKTKSPEEISPPEKYDEQENKSIESVMLTRETEVREEVEKIPTTVEVECHSVTPIEINLSSAIELQSNLGGEEEEEVSEGNIKINQDIAADNFVAQEEMVVAVVSEKDDAVDLLSSKQEQVKVEDEINLINEPVKQGEERTVPLCTSALIESTSAFVANAPCIESNYSPGYVRVQGVDHARGLEDDDDNDDSGDEEDKDIDQVNFECEIATAHVVKDLEVKDDESHDEAKDLYNKVVEEVEYLIEKSGSTDLIKSISGEKLSSCTESAPSVSDVRVESSSNQDVKVEGETSSTENIVPSTMNAILKDWGKPLGLPYPPITSERVRSTSTSRFGGRSTSVKPARVKSDESKNIVYLDLAYVPHHGNAHYCNA